MSTTLEQQIASALSSDTKSDVIALLITEVETAIIAADKAAEAEREKALDPLASPDAAKARAVMEEAAFVRDRLRTVLPRLQERLQQVQAAEYAARWQADFEQVEGQRDELAQEYAATYPSLVAQLVDLFSRAEAIDMDVSRVNGSAPAGERRRLAVVELAARNLDSFSAADPSITKAVQLPDWEHSAKTAWPPPRPFDPSWFAPSPADPRCSGDWWQVKEEEARALRERWSVMLRSGKPRRSKTTTVRDGGRERA
jgi:hypothetical protein